MLYVMHTQYANMANKSIHHEALTYINQMEALQSKLTGLTFKSTVCSMMCVCTFAATDQITGCGLYFITVVPTTK